MAKRFVTIFFIVMGITLFLITGFFGVLILAPGFQAFGLKYVTIGARKYDSGEVRVLEKMNDLGYNSFTGTLKIEADEVPIEVYYHQGYDYYIRYYEDYSGFTRTDIDYPSMKISRDNLGNAVVKITGFKAWVFKNSNTKRFLKIYIPITGVSAQFAGKTDLQIKANTSSITFSKELEGEEKRIPSFRTVDIETNGKVTFNTKVKAINYKFTTDSSIIINKDGKDVVDATNYELESRLGRITVEKPVDGNLKATTKNYDIKLISCVNLTATSNYGDIICANSKNKINLSGMAYIKTKTGRVSLGKVNGGAKSEITTTSGRVSIDKILDADITTRAGSVRIDSVRNVNIETTTGKVVIEEVLGSADIDTHRGSIVLGGEGMTVKNIDVYSRIGRITVLSATENVKLITVKSNIDFTNTSSEKVDITCGGKLTAINLTGDVDLHSEKDAHIEFTDITEDTYVTFGDECKNVTIKALNNSKADIEYTISGEMVYRYEDNDNGTGTFSKLERRTKITNRLNGPEPNLDVSGKNATILVYLKSSAERD